MAPATVHRAFRLPTDVPDDVNATADEVLGVARQVRNALGAGLPERFYHRAMEMALTRRLVPFLSKPKVPILYEGATLGHVQPDLVVRDHLVVELKAVEEIHPLHEAQVLTYLTATGLPLGLLVNCNAVPFGLGIRRKVNANSRAPAG